MYIRGSISIFLSIILIPVITVTSILVDLARYRFAEKIVKSSVQLAVESSLSQYQRDLKEQYGIMALYEADPRAIREDLRMLIEENLSFNSDSKEGYIDMFGFNVEKVDVLPMFNLSEDYVIKKQAVEFMKYRAPISATNLFIEKVRTIASFLKQSSILEEKLELDRKFNDIRQTQVLLHMILDEKILKFNPMLVRNYRAKIDTAIEKLSGMQMKEKNISNYIDYFNKSCYKYTLVKSDIEKFKAKIHDLENKKKHLGNINIVLTSTEASISEYTEEEVEELNKIDLEISDIELRINKKSAEESALLNDMKLYTDKIKTEIDALRNLFYNVNSYAYAAKKYIKKEIIYIKKALELAQLITDRSKKCLEEIRRFDVSTKETNEVFIKKIKIDIEKRKKLIPQDFVRKELIEPLTVFKGILNSCYAQIKNLTVYIDKLLKKTDSLKEALRRFNKNYSKACSTLPEFRYYNSLNYIKDNCVKKINIRQMPEIKYLLQTPVTNKEKNEFYNWCKKNLNEKIPLLSENTSNKKILNEFKKEVKREIEKEAKQEKNNLESIFKKLPSYRDKNGIRINVKNTGEELKTQNNYSSMFNLVKNTNFSETKKGYYDEKIENAGIWGDRLNKIILSSGEEFIENIYENEYILKVFKNLLLNKADVKKDFIEKCADIRGNPMEKRDTVVKNEVEYIIYGKHSDSINEFWAKASIGSIRLALNLIYIYLDQQKNSTALAIAAAIGGWTIFGVPVIKNLIMFAWAAAESAIDVSQLFQGKEVPLYKTSATWNLDLSNAVGELKDLILQKGVKSAEKKINDLAGCAEETFKRVLKQKIENTVDKIFLPVEEATDSVSAIAKQNLVYKNAEDSAISIKGLLEAKTVNDIEELIGMHVKNKINNLLEDTKNYSKNKLFRIKSKLKYDIFNTIINSDTYKRMKSEIIDAASSVVKSASKRIDSGFKRIEKLVPNKCDDKYVSGSFLSLNYLDYLRIFLLLVPQEVKNYRIADLMQLNIGKIYKKNGMDFKMADHATFLYVNVDVSMKYIFLSKWFMPENKNHKRGNIHVEWCFGY